jgi:CRP-like cAMP-binding protein
VKTISELLGNHEFFAGLDDEAIAVIAGCGTNVHFDTDERIITAEMPADRILVVRSGRVALELHTPRGGSLILDTIGPDEILGVSWMLPPYRWTFDARAVEPTSAVALDAACLRGKCDHDPALGYELFKRFAGLVRDRLQAARLQLIDVYGNPTS